MQSNVLFTRTAPAIKRAKALLESLAESYKSGEYCLPHKIIKNGKESYSVHPSKHTGTAGRLATLAERISVDPTMQSEKFDLTKTIYFAGLNIVGNISEISMYFAQRLGHSSTPFDLDAAQYGFASFLLGLSHVDPSVDPAVTITSSNVNNEGKLRVLAGFEEYALAESDSQKEAAIDRIYNDFVLRIFDVCEANFAQQIKQFTNGESGIGTYNSSAVNRNNIRDQLRNYLVQYEPLSTLFSEIHSTSVTGEKSVYYPSVVVDRVTWLKDKGTARAVNNENTMSIFEIPALALDAKVVTQVVALVPAKLRPKDKVTHVVSYPVLGLNPWLAYKMAYATGISSSASELDVSPGQTLGETGNKRKALTIAQAAENLIKHFAGYFDPSGKSNIINMEQIITRKKYIDITSANPGQASKFQLTSITSNTALLYPDMHVPSEIYQGKAYFEKNPALAFQTIIYSLGFSTNKIGVHPEHIQQVVKQLYIIFGKEAPATVMYNSLPSKSSNGSNALGAMYGVQPTSYMPVAPVHHGLPTGFSTHHIGLDHSLGVPVNAAGGQTGLPFMETMQQTPVVSTGGEL